MGHFESAQSKGRPGISGLIDLDPESPKDGQNDLGVCVVRLAIFAHVGRGDSA
jgi:hypothetical protein